MCLISWLYMVHKYVLLCFISVKVITRYHTITISGIKHTEVVYKENTYTFSIILTSLRYWPLTSQSRCKILMLNVFKISFPPPTDIKYNCLILEMYMGKTQREVRVCFPITVTIPSSHLFLPSKFTSLTPIL